MLQRNFFAVLIYGTFLAGILLAGAESRLFANPAVPENDKKAETREKLKNTLVLKVDETPLGEILRDLSEKYEIEFVLDAEVDPEKPITLDLRGGITLRATLHFLLNRHDLTYKIEEDGTIRVTEEEKFYTEDGVRIFIDMLGTRLDQEFVEMMESSMKKTPDKNPSCCDSSPRRVRKWRLFR